MKTAENQPRIPLIVLLSFVSMLCWARPSLLAYPGYEPRVDGRPLHLSPCKIKWTENDGSLANAEILSGYIDCDGRGGSGLRAKFAYGNDQLRLDLLAKGITERFVSPRRWHSLSTACTNDFNRDRTPDLMLVFWGGGNGLAALYVDVMFLLSGTRGYEASILNTMDLASLFRSREGKIKFLHKQAVGAETDFDKKWHTFWVYHFFGFEGTELRLLPEEAIWIMFTFKRNHQPTSKLTSAQKRVAWAEHEKHAESLEVRRITPNK